MSNKVFFYHENCKDGIGAAYAAFERYGDEARYFPINYGKEDKALVNVNENSEVFFIDFSLKRGPMIELANKVNNITVIDHHDSAEKELVDLPANVEVNFNMEKSGAVMTWEYLHDTPAPKMLQYIEDRDIWKWKMPKSREISEGIIFFTKDNDIPAFKALMDKEQETMKKFLEVGSVLYEAKMNRINAVVEKIRADPKKFTYTIEGVEFLLVNSTEKSEVSELGNEIAAQLGKPAAIYSVNGERVGCSLRSTEEIGIINQVAIAFGGGGHPLASGLGLDIDKLSKLLKTRSLNAGEKILIPSQLENKENNEEVETISPQ